MQMTGAQMLPTWQVLRNDIAVNLSETEADKPEEFVF